MAEIQSSQTSKQKGVRKCKKLSTRVDLTPMVDLGFLLITFFIFTTTLHEPKVARLVMPSDKIDNYPTNIPESKVLQVILAENNKIFYYFGNNVLSTGVTNFSPSGIRNVILKKQHQVAAKYGTKEVLILMIKPLSNCSYKNIIDILDEVQINNIKHYVFTEPNKDEQKIMNTL
jgi:biopolymer transport protein ExbD